MSFEEIKKRAQEWRQSKAAGEPQADAVLRPLEVRIATARRGRLDPAVALTGIAEGGYEGLNNALARGVAETLAELQTSRLRTRDAAGRSVAAKWRTCREAEGAQKVVVARMAALKDQALLAGDPQGVLEGLLLAAYCVGAAEARLCVDVESLALAARAVAEARELGIVGESVLGNAFACEVTVCEAPRGLGGEEPSILLNHLEGKPARARVTPPEVEASGLLGRPTVVETLETLALAAAVLREGAEWFAAIGAQDDPGTKLVQLTGAFAGCGVVEVPTSTTLRQLVSEVAGAKAGALKAVQVGYPAGLWLPEAAWNVALDHASLKAAGCGASADVLTGATAAERAVELARRSAVAAHELSCGQCSFGREGTRQLMEVLSDLVRGRGQAGDFELLLKLADGMKAGSLCANGRLAPEAVTSALEHFRAEFDAHLNNKQCLAGACNVAGVVEK